jgi:transcriptional regulator with XRE-family HTH domain
MSHNLLLSVEKIDKQYFGRINQGQVDTLVNMTDGERLRVLLKDNRKTVEDLAVALDKSKQLVYKYQKMNRFSPTVVEMMERGLQKLGIETLGAWGKPNAITDPDELRGLLEGIPRDALPRIKRMLDLDQNTKLFVKALIDDRLDRHR